jgi:polysaccharide deacetylase 2 family uncharacterized protein YibQ
VAQDDLTTPLGQTAKKKRHSLPIAQIFASLLGICVLGFGLWIAFANDPFGGEPVIVVAADVRAVVPSPETAGAAPTSAASQAIRSVPQAAEAPPAAPPGDTITIIDGMSGKRQQVVLASPRGASVDQRLAEPSRHGLIPKIAGDGARSSDVYAQPVPTSARGEAPRIAIIIGGLGIGSNGTYEALGKLPGGVTFGFVPYGTDLERWVSRARGEGHEVLLQVPMEPFDYPDNDPGPQTLLTTLTPAQNLDRLYWAMSRFQGYVGLANFMGARFTANEQAFAPLLREAAKRGLLYFDDGSSARSVAGQIAGANNLPFARADIVLDATPTPAAIEAALAKLEVIARERGSAIGVVSALPASITRISNWARGAEGRGILLVPVSTVAKGPKSS